MPIPKIGNHPTDCPCATCTNARKRLAASPYVQLLQRELIAAHDRLGETATATPDLATEHEILRLRDELARSQDGERILSNTLTESRKICQEREKQLANQSADLRLIAQVAGVGGHQPESYPNEIKRVLGERSKRLESAQGLLIEIAAAVGARPDEPALDKIKSLREERGGLAAGIENGKQYLEQIWLALPESWRPADKAKLLDSVKLFATGWNDLQEKQRGAEKQLAEATTALELAKKRADNLEAERTGLMTALNQADTSIEQERRAGWTETRVVGIVAVVLSGLAFFLIGRFGR